MGGTGVHWAVLSTRLCVKMFIMGSWRLYSVLWKTLNFESFWPSQRSLHFRHIPHFLVSSPVRLGWERCWFHPALSSSLILTIPQKKAAAIRTSVTSSGPLILSRGSLLIFICRTWKSANTTCFHSEPNKPALQSHLLLWVPFCLDP